MQFFSTKGHMGQRVSRVARAPRNLCKGRVGCMSYLMSNRLQPDSSTLYTYAQSTPESYNIFCNGLDSWVSDNGTWGIFLLRHLIPRHNSHMQ